MEPINEPIYPLTRDAFATAIRRGQGRALLHVQRHGATGLDDLVRDACLYETVFGHQIEDRAPWLFEVLRAAALIEAVEEYEEGRRRSRAAELPAPTAEGIRQRIETRDIVCLRLVARRADDDTFNAVFDALLAEDSLEYIADYLVFFSAREMPRLDARVLDWARSPDRQLRRRAIGALAQIQDERVRALALELLDERGRDALVDGVPELLARNYRPGDHSAIKRHLALGADDAETHRICMSLRDLYEAQPIPEFVPLALWVHEHSPCGLCRKVLYRAFKDSEGVPDWPMEEFAHDAYAIAEAAFVEKSS